MNIYRVTYFYGKGGAKLIIHDESPAEVIDLRANKERPLPGFPPPTPPKTLKAWPRWMSITQATEYISLSDKTLLQLITDGKIKAKNIRRKYLIDRESIDSFMQSDEAEVEEALERLREIVK